MTKSEFREKIKTLAKQVYSKTNALGTKSTKIDLDNPSTVSLDSTRFPVLNKFPTLYDTLVKLLTVQFDLFLKDIEWVAPRPTTFRIILGNDQVFYLIYTDRTWIGKVEGKRYYLLNLSEEQNCIESIARILSYGAKEVVKEEKPTNSDTPETSSPESPSPESSWSSSPAPESPAPESPTPESPAPESPAPPTEETPA
jgi:hypothetical protein